MKTTHHAEFSARCPATGAKDYYAVWIRVARIVMVEDVIAFLRRFEDVTAFQEAITQEIADHFHAPTRTEGRHSGVLTTCECEPVTEQ